MRAGSAYWDARLGPRRESTAPSESITAGALGLKVRAVATSILPSHGRSTRVTAANEEALKRLRNRARDAWNIYPNPEDQQRRVSHLTAAHQRESGYALIHLWASSSPEREAEFINVIHTWLEEGRPRE
jgi:hypothetical protein